MRRCAFSLVLLLLVIVFSMAQGSAAPVGEAKPVVTVIPIDGTIDLGLSPLVERALKEAEQDRAAAVVLDVNTFGGRVDAAVAIRDALLRSRLPSVAFVNKRAISAGALISLAAERIVMARGATLGAATPVQAGQPGGETKPVDEKVVSYVRKEFRATADARGRPGLLAEAMVDPDVEVPGVVEKGKLLTLTTDEALRHDVAGARADSLAELLVTIGLPGAELRHVTPNWAERLVRFLTHPVVASLLMTVGMLGILIEIRTPGFGVPGALGLLSISAFFWGHWLVALVGWEQLLLVAAGLILLAVELFLLPGFGVAGVLGIIALVAGLSSSLFGSGASLGAMLHATSRVAISAAAALLAGLVLLRFLPSLPGGKRLVLATALPGGGRTEDAARLAPGATGIALSALRPAGIAAFANRPRVDVVSEGEFIGAGATVEVVRDDGTRVVVRLGRPANTEGATG